MFSCRDAAEAFATKFASAPELVVRVLGHVLPVGRCLGVCFGISRRSCHHNLVNPPEMLVNRPVRIGLPTIVAGDRALGVITLRAVLVGNMLPNRIRRDPLVIFKI